MAQNYRFRCTNNVFEPVPASNVKNEYITEFVLSASENSPLTRNIELKCIEHRGIQMSFKKHNPVIVRFRCGDIRPDDIVVIAHLYKNEKFALAMNILTDMFD